MLTSNKMIISLPYVTLAAGLSLITYLILKSYDMPLNGIDDANIFFVYAHHFSSGHGIVYNIGDERVEGYSSTGWFLLTSIVFYLKWPTYSLLFINFALVTIANSFVIHFLNRRFSSESTGFRLLLQISFALLVLTHYKYVSWVMITFMDITLWSSALTLLIVLILSDTGFNLKRIVTLVLISCLPLVRSEGFLVAPLLIALYHQSILFKSGKICKRSLIISVASFAACAGILTGFRLIYFGYFFPNTYYAKVSPSLLINLQSGWRYIYGYFSEGPALLAMYLYVLVFGGNLVKRFGKSQAPKEDLSAYLNAAVLIACIMGITIVTGGDHFVNHRFIQAIFPVSIFLLVYCVGVSRPSRIQMRAGMFVIALVFGFNISHLISSNNSKPLASEYQLVVMGRKVGTTLFQMNRYERRLPTIGVFTAGANKLYYPGQVYDLLGLNSTTIAHHPGRRDGLKNHAAFSKEIFFELKPDILGAQLPPLGQSNFFTLVTKGLFYDKQFQAEYVYGTLKKDDIPLPAFYRKSYLSQLTDPTAKFAPSTMWVNDWLGHEPKEKEKINLEASRSTH